MKKLKELVAMFSQSDTAGMGPYGIYSLGIEKQIQNLTHRTSVPDPIHKILGLLDPDPSINKQKTKKNPP